MDKPLWSLRVQAPFGARVLSFVCCAPNDGFGPQSGLVQRGVLYAAAWGSENRQPGFAQGAADWRSGPRWSILSVLCPVHPFPLCGTSPQGETRDMREKTGASYASCTTPAFPPLVAGATTMPGGKHVTGFSVAYGSLRIQFLCHPRSSVGRQKESALMGRLGALLRPTWRSYAGPPQWHYNPCLL